MLRRNAQQPLEAPAIDPMTTSIDLGHWRSAISHPDHLVAGRWVLADGVEVDDPDRDGTLVFLTNHPTFGATTIAAIYKDRWQVEERAAAQGDGPGVVPSRAECSFRRRGGANRPGSRGLRAEK